ncbi:TAXI family TRAP transporter solute-binding subunit [Dysosmobacter sp.]|uniref:TAXI family TRAP transporter solute-binding subunit n=1 Tax=Dysosmobacter sp. TaxID=2591382 RepID=UPI002A96E7E2|nr:TAXI family TRAP transporter solute-binding subunit [Dysosmobacter sp.]MDY5510998.1 TAXI family TRAP transporter solute-binding subunit [Dysosmobacter sp.]
MKKYLSLLLAVLMTASLLAGCGGDTASDDTAADDTASTETGDTAASTGSGVELKFTTGGDQGTYYGFGTVLAQYVTSNTGSKVTAVVSNGSQDNIEQMDLNTAQLGFVQSDVMSYAYNGERLFEGMAVENFSTVAALYMEQVQIVTCDPSIQSVADLKGKNVSIGASGSGVYYNALDVLAAYGLTEQDINPTFQDFGNSVDALQDGKIDAAFVVAGAPTVAVTSLATAKDVYLVSLDDEHIEALKAECPYYEKYVIPEGTYEGVAETTTVAVGAVVIARDDVAEDDVYNFVSAIFENADSLAHDKAGELDLEFASSVTAVPYHPGAAKYFAEKGIEVPTK